MAQRIHARDFGRVVRERLKGEKRRIEDAAVETCARAVGELVAAGDRAGLVDSGQFRQGWSSQSIKGGAEVGNNAPHAAAIEHGRRPNQPGPPIEPIRRWVERKLQPPPEQLDALAWAIRNRIHRQGSKPRLILTSYRPRLRALFRATVQRRLTLNRSR